MTRRSVTSVWRKIAFAILFVGSMSTASIAQTDVEIEVAGPWSYVRDSDPSRITIAAPQGHTLAIFTGENIFKYAGIANPPGKSHRIDFSTLPCGSSTTSAFFLYPVNGVSDTAIQTGLSNASTSIS